MLGNDILHLPLMVSYSNIWGTEFAQYSITCQESLEQCGGEVTQSVKRLGYGIEVLSSTPGKGKRFFSFTQSLDRLLGPKIVA